MKNLSKEDKNALSETKEASTPLPTELVQPKGDELAEVESMMRTDVRLGMEELEQEDIPTPSLMLIQNNSTLVDDNGVPYKRGMFFYKGTKQLFSEVSCSLLSFTKKEMPSFSNKELMEKTYVFLGVLDPEFKPFVLFLESTGIGAAKQFLGEVVARNVPMYSLKVKLSAETINGEKGTYYKIKFSIAGLRDDYSELSTVAGLTRKYSHKIKEATPESSDKDFPF